jgi:hypothetical protein
MQGIIGLIPHFAVKKDKKNKLVIILKMLVKSYRVRANGSSILFKVKYPYYLDKINIIDRKDTIKTRSFLLMTKQFP